jgi:hypothetical protein
MSPILAVDIILKGRKIKQGIVRVKVLLGEIHLGLFANVRQTMKFGTGRVHDVAGAYPRVEQGML